MYLYLDAIYKSDDGSVKQGDQVGGSYIKRIITGETKDGRPQYRYLRSKEEVEAYENEQSKKRKGGSDKKDEEKDTLKEKLEGEQKESKKKLERDPALFLDKEKTKKSLTLYVED